VSAATEAAARRAMIDVLQRAAEEVGKPAEYKATPLDAALILPAMAIGAGVGVFRAYALSSLWALFVVPLGVPAVGLWQAYGLLLVVGLTRILPLREYRETRPGPMLDSIKHSALVVFVTGVALALGHFVAWMAA
jgi:hypothetical protein